MAERKRIGLRDVRALRPNQILWDSAVAGFHARRQRGPGVTYAVFYRTAEGRQRWHKIGRHGAPWTPDHAREEAVRISAALLTAPTRRPSASLRVRRKRSPNCAISTSPMPGRGGC